MFSQLLWSISVVVMIMVRTAWYGKTNHLALILKDIKTRRNDKFWIVTFNSTEKSVKIMMIMIFHQSLLGCFLVGLVHLLVGWFVLAVLVLLFCWLVVQSFCWLLSLFSVWLVKKMKIKNQVLAFMGCLITFKRTVGPWRSYALYPSAKCYFWFINKHPSKSNLI